jgi:hypothetical protein
LEQIAEAAKQVRVARALRKEATANLDATTDGTTSSLPGEGLAHFESADAKLEEALAAFGAGSEAMRAYIAHLVGGSGSGVSDMAGGPQSPSKPSSPTSNDVGEFEPERPSARWVAAVRRLGWPRNAGGLVLARGLLLTSDGKQVTKAPLKAGRGPADDVNDLKEPWATDPEMRTRWHIEGHVAAFMRKHRMREAVLYLNLPPCGGQQPIDPKRCHENLPRILPQGSKLHVHAVRENGWSEVYLYEGTGEALK